jgi:flagellar biosynthesis GTPase FlhF
MVWSTADHKTASVPRMSFRVRLFEAGANGPVIPSAKAVGQYRLACLWDPVTSTRRTGNSMSGQTFCLGGPARIAAGSFRRNGQPRRRDNSRAPVRYTFMECCHRLDLVTVLSPEGPASLQLFHDVTVGDTRFTMSAPAVFAQLAKSFQAIIQPTAAPTAKARKAAKKAAKAAARAAKKAAKQPSAAKKQPTKPKPKKSKKSKQAQQAQQAQQAKQVKQARQAKQAAKAMAKWGKLAAEQAALLTSSTMPNNKATEKLQRGIVTSKVAAAHYAQSHHHEMLPADLPECSLTSDELVLLRDVFRAAVIQERRLDVRATVFGEILASTAVQYKDQHVQVGLRARALMTCCNAVMSQQGRTYDSLRYTLTPRFASMIVEATQPLAADTTPVLPLPPADSVKSIHSIAPNVINVDSSSSDSDDDSSDTSTDSTHSGSSSSTWSSSTNRSDRVVVSKPSHAAANGSVDAAPFSVAEVSPSDVLVLHCAIAAEEALAVDHVARRDRVVGRCATECSTRFATSDDADAMIDASLAAGFLRQAVDGEGTAVLLVQAEHDLRLFDPEPAVGAEARVCEDDVIWAEDAIVQFLRRRRDHSAMLATLARDVFRHSSVGVPGLRRALERGLVWMDEPLLRPLQVVTLHASLCFELSC